MDRIAHSLEIRLSKEFGHRRSRNGSRLWYEEGMSASPTGIVAVVLSVVV